jgi:TP901 family phage tail tape measure protein
MSLGSVSLNMVWNPAIKGSSFLQASMKGIHTYAKSVTKANLLGSTKFSLLNRNIKTLDNHLGHIRKQTAKISANPIRLDIKTSRNSLMGARKDMNEIERSAKQTAFYSKKNADNLRASAMTQKNQQRRQRNNTGNNAGNMLGGAMVMGAIAMPFKAGVDFEAKMTDVRALTKGSIGADGKRASSITAKEFDLLNSKAKELGATTEWSAVQASEGMSFLAKAGFDTKQQLGAMDGVLGLATVGNVDLGVSADIASNILSGFSIDASKMNDVANVLAKTFTTSNTDLIMLGETMKYTGAMASGLGVGITEVSALAGKLGDVGIQGSMAGTSLRQMYSRMSAPPTEAKKAMDRLGISAYDAQDKFKGLPTLLGEINEKTKGLDAGTKNKLLKDMFGMTALSSGIALLKVGKENLDLYQKSLEGNEDAIARIREMKLNTVQGQFKLLGSAFEGLSISATTGLLVPLKLIVGGITSVVTAITWFTDTFPVFGGTILAIASTLAVGTVALTAFGFASNMMSGSFATGMSALSGMIGFVRNFSLMTSLATAKQWLFNIALNANPFGLVVMGITALIGFGMILYDTFEPVRNLFDSIGKFGSQVTGWLGFGSDTTSTTTKDETLNKNIKTTLKKDDDSSSSWFSWGSDDKKTLQDKPKLLDNIAVNNKDYQKTFTTSSLKEIDTNIVPLESVSAITNQSNIEKKEMMLNNNSNRKMDNTFNIEINTNGSMPSDEDVEDFKIKVKKAIKEIDNDAGNVRIAS